MISTAAEGLAWLAGDGSGAFSAAVGLVPPPFYPSGLSIVDVDLDGLLDLVWHRELAGAKVQQAMFGLGEAPFAGADAHLGRLHAEPVPGRRSHW